MNGMKIPVLAAAGLLCLGISAEATLAAGGRFPLIQRAVGNVQARFRARAEAPAVDGALTPQNDPFAGQAPPTPASPHAAAGAQPQQPPSRRFFRRWPAPPAPEPQMVQRVPTLAPPRQSPDRMRGVAPPLPLAGPKVPTLAPTEPSADARLTLQAQPSPAVKQAVSILVAPGEGKRRGAGATASPTPAKVAPPEESGGPREF